MWEKEKHGSVLTTQTEQDKGLLFVGVTHTEPHTPGRLRPPLITDSP